MGVPTIASQACMQLGQTGCIRKCSETTAGLPQANAVLGSAAAPAPALGAREPLTIRVRHGAVVNAAAAAAAAPPAATRPSVADPLFAAAAAGPSGAPRGPMQFVGEGGDGAQPTHFQGEGAAAIALPAAGGPAPAKAAGRRLLAAGARSARSRVRGRGAAAGGSGYGRQLQAAPPPPASEGEGGEGGAAPAPMGATDGCFPDFQTWKDFELWLDGRLVGAPPLRRLSRRAASARVMRSCVCVRFGGAADDRGSRASFPGIRS